jgi:hypothetical protein
MSLDLFLDAKFCQVCNTYLDLYNKDKKCNGCSEEINLKCKINYLIKLWKM